MITSEAYMKFDSDNGSEAVFEKITTKLRLGGDLSNEMLTFAFWLGKALSQPEFDILEKMEAEFGVEFCNQRLCEAMEDSGRFLSKDGEVEFVG